jgi:hypothetical protein
MRVKGVQRFKPLGIKILLFSKYLRRTACMGSFLLVGGTFLFNKNIPRRMRWP